jgi:Ca-activated chloride channel homolog
VRTNVVAGLVHGLSAAAVAWLMLFGASGRAQVPTFRSNVEAVRIDVLVSEGGRPVRGLQRPDFDVRDNGVSQQVDLVSTDQAPLNVVLVLDASESVAGERLDHLRTASRDLLAALAPDDRAALVTFNDAVALSSPLSSSFSRLASAIDHLAPRGATALLDATYTGMVIGDAAVGRGLVILFTDGVDTASCLTVDQVMDTARRSEVVVYPASVGNAGRRSVLRDLARQTGGRPIEIESTRSLSKTFLEILGEFRDRYLLSYVPRGVTRQGWHEVTVKISGRGRAVVKARPGYVAGF